MCSRSCADSSSSSRRGHFGDHLDAGIAPSVDSQGDAYDKALAEAVIGLYKTEVIRRKGHGRTLKAVEFATLTWVDWFNTRRLLGPLGNIPPAEFEAQYYQQAEVGGCDTGPYKASGPRPETRAAP